MKRMSTFATMVAFTATFILSVAGINAQAQTVLASTQTYETAATNNNIYYEEQNNSFQAVIFPRLNGMVSVNVTKNADEIVKIRVLNSKGVVLNEESIKKNNLVAKRYSLSGFPTGTYIFEVASDKKMIRKEITLD